MTETKQTLDDVLDGLTMEATFVAEVKRRTKVLMREQFEEIRDLISMIHLDHGGEQSPEECKRFRRVYDLLLEKINETK